MDLRFQLLVIVVLFRLDVCVPNTLDDLQKDYGEWRLQRSPEYSTAMKFHKYNDKTETFAYKGFDEEFTKSTNLLNGLMNTVVYNQLSPKQKTDYDIFKDTLTTMINGYKWRDYNALNPINFLEGPQIDPSYLQSITPFDTVGDFENYLKRLEDYPKQIDEMIERMNKAIEKKHTYHRVSVNRIPGQIDDVLKNAQPTTFPMYLPFKDRLPKSSIDETKKQDLDRKAQAAVSKIIDKYRHLKQYFNQTYFKHLRPKFGVNSWDNGTEFYKACLRWHLSLDITPDEVHEKGLSEVKRISSEMKKIMVKLNHQGSVKEFFANVRQNRSFYLQNGQEIIKWYKDRIKNKIEPQLPKFFKDLPNLPVDVQPNPIDGIGGQYLAGPPDGSRPGTFQVNVFHPEKSVTIDFMALLLHETIPGHHLQGSVQSTNVGPAYRRYNLDDKYFQPPFLPPFYTAYLEGWALYAESLGEEMGLYEDDYELMGRYGSEIFRACRLVVDTGLHHFNWTRDMAIEFMLNYTAYSEQSISTEVDRYLTWPGQACGYKIGELKIKELRAKAQKDLGSKFDIKDFHSIILKDGALPLDILTKNVNQWIDETKRASSVTAAPCISKASTNSRHLNLLVGAVTMCFLFKFRVF
nr:uncharacterized protein LOC105326090 isoform X1 [Crassostrea gigas]XP_034328349.1 uncharacterized protein LOC105326090 isoform X1 [Crassostrea gigas]XP_034328350.1 uncharacterized protein LOC105326090 isoform X1 [Crassostrea gigas]XP_034328351.1 uncharacterized protein LOC105326090 isoform X1 [Crassostrea gigas]XP_034328352.1 uncharacterized protein LOC105326090 isoform X1 [Crassostrea gigas]